MIDLRLLRESVEEGGDIKLVKYWQRIRNLDTDVVDQASSLDAERRRILREIGLCRCEKGNIKSRHEHNISDAKALKERIASLEKLLHTVQSELDIKLSCIGNMVDDEADKFIHLSHVEFLSDQSYDEIPKSPKKLQIIDPLWCIGGYEVFGSGHGASLSGVGIDLSRGLVDYATWFLSRKQEQKLINPPSTMDTKQCFKILGRRKEDNVSKVESQPTTSIPAHLALSLIHERKSIPERSLPLNFCAITSVLNNESTVFCEQLNHTFMRLSSNHNTRKIKKKNKVQIPTFVHPTEGIDSVVFSSSDPDSSRKIQSEILEYALEFYTSLNIECRVVKVSPESLLPCESSCFIIEAYFPVSDAYFSIGSIANYMDYISRTLKIRCGTKKIDDIEKYFIHTVSLSLCRIESLLPAVLECNADEEGITLPTTLLPFLRSCDMQIIPYIRKKSRGKGGKTFITEEKILRKGTSTNYADSKRRTDFSLDKKVREPTHYCTLQTTPCFGDSFELQSPTQAEIYAELICSEFSYPSPHET